MTELGFRPNRGTLILSEGADWICSIDSPDVWEPGTEVWVEFPDLDIRWDATVDPLTGVAGFKTEQSETTAEKVPNGSVFRLFFKAPGEPSAEYLWFVGKVKRID